MFAAMSENPDFWKERMNLFVAIAPSVFLSNLGSTVIRTKG